jgi:WD40 repeat protein
METRVFSKVLKTAFVCTMISLGALAQDTTPAYSLIVQMSHAGYINKILFDRQRRQMATVSNGGEIKIWDVVRRQEVWTFKNKLGVTAIGFGAIAFNSDGSELAVAGDSGLISIIDLRTGSSREVTAPYDVISSIIFNHAGDKLGVGGFGGRIDIVFLSNQPPTVETIYEPPHPSNADIATAINEGKGLESVSAVLFTPSGDCLISGSTEGNIYQLDLNLDHPVPRLLLHADGRVFGLVHTSNSLIGAVANLTDNSIGIWDVGNKREIVKRTNCNTQVDVPNVALGGGLAATTCFDDKARSNTYELWRLPSGDSVPIPIGLQKMNIQSPSTISDDGSLLATTDGNQRLTVTDLDAPGEPQDMEQSPVHVVDRLEYLSSTHELEVSTGDQAYLWQTSGTTAVKTYFARYGQVAFTDDGLWVAYFDPKGRLLIENRKNHTLIETPIIDTLVFRIAIGGIGPTVFWMDGAGYGGYAKFWRPGETSSHVLCQTDLGGEIAVSRLGSYSLIGCNRGQQRFSSADVLLFRNRDMRLLREEYGDLTGVDSFAPNAVSVMSLFFTSNEAQYGINFGYQLRLRETAGNQKIEIPSDIENGWRFAWATAVSSDMRYLAAQEAHFSLGGVDKSQPTFMSLRLTLLDLKTGNRVHDAAIESIAKTMVFVGDKLMVGSIDGAVTVRSVPNLSSLATLVHPNGWLAIAPDGFFDGNAQALHWIGWRPEGKRTIIPLDLLYDNFYRPDLLIDILGSRYKASKPTLGTELGLGSIEMMARQGYVHTERSGSGWLLCFSDPPVNSVAVYSDGAPLSFASDQIVRGPNFTCPWAAHLPQGATKIESMSDQPVETQKPNHCPDAGHLADRPPTQPGVLRLLTVAVGTYSPASGYRSLPSTVSSAIAIENLFSDLPHGRGRLFVDVDVRPALRDGEIPPTLANIRKSWDELVARTKPQDTVVLFLFGHGLVPQGTQMFYFAPVDFDTTSLATKRATGVSVAMIADMIREVPARNIVLIIDSCQSGAALTSLARIGDIKVKIQNKLSPGMPVGVYTLASATAFQEAISLSSTGPGPLAKVLMHAVSQHSKSAKGAISAGSLLRDLCRDLPSETKQTPLVYFAGKDFPLLDVPR